MDMKISLSGTKIPPAPFAKGGETPGSPRKAGYGVLRHPHSPFSKGGGGILKSTSILRISAQAAQYGKNPEPYQLQIGFRANGFHGGMTAKPENV
jgi:hypothetical protein